MITRQLWRIIWFSREFSVPKVELFFW